MSRNGSIAAGLNESGGGLNLSLLYSTLLDFAGDNDGVTLDQAIGVIEVPLANQFPRMEHLYGRRGRDAVAACVGEALTHLGRRDILRPRDDGWALGPRFVFGKPMTIVRARRGSAGTAIRHTVVTRGERDRLAAADHHRDAIRRAAEELREGGQGLRPIDDNHVQQLMQSVQEFGLRDDLHPVLEDQEKRILSGRHRLEAARRLGRTWRRRTIRVRDDDEALAIAWAANCDRPWADRDRARLAKWGIVPEQALSTAAKRDLIRAALLAAPMSRNRRIAAPLGVHKNTVQAVREELEGNGQIAHFEPPPGRPRSDGSVAPGASVRRRVELPPDWPRTGWGPAKLHLSHDPAVAAEQLKKFPREFVVWWLGELERRMREGGG